MNKTRNNSALPSFSGLPAAANHDPNGDLTGPRPVVHANSPAAVLRSASAPKPTSALLNGGGGSSSGGGRKRAVQQQQQQGDDGASCAVMVQDTLTPLLDEVDVLFSKSQEIVASLNRDASVMQEEEVTYLLYSTVYSTVHSTALHCAAPYYLCWLLH